MYEPSQENRIGRPEAPVRTGRVSRILRGFACLVGFSVGSIPAAWQFGNLSGRCNGINPFQPLAHLSFLCTGLLGAFAVVAGVLTGRRLLRVMLLCALVTWLMWWNLYCVLMCLDTVLRFGTGQYHVLENLAIAATYGLYGGLFALAVRITLAPIGVAAFGLSGLLAGLASTMALGRFPTVDNLFVSCVILSSGWVLGGAVFGALAEGKLRTATNASPGP